MSRSLNNESERQSGENRQSQALSQSLALSKMMRQGRSFSGRERNCCFLNTGSREEGGRFADISAASGLDFPDDSRALALVDWDHDGDLDLWVSNRNAPRLRFLRNDMSRGKHFLGLRLIGMSETTNRDAIGARIEVVTDPSDPLRRMQTLRAGEGFLAQSSKWLHFGLGEEDTIQRVLVRWPGGESETFEDLKVDCRYRLVQGSGTAEVIATPPRQIDLAVSLPQATPPSDRAGIRIETRLQTPSILYRPWTVGREQTNQREPFVLINLWASWCQPCIKELTEFQQRAKELQKAGVVLVALSVDGLGEDSSDPAAAEALVKRLKLSFTAHHATGPQIALLQQMHDLIVPTLRPLPVPSSFLIDPRGRLIAIYKGAISVDQLIQDIRLQSSTEDAPGRTALLEGQSIDHPRIRQVTLETELTQRYTIARLLEKLGSVEEAIAHYQEIVRIKPDLAKAHYNVGTLRLAQKRLEQSIVAFRRAVKLKPSFVEAHANLGVALSQQGLLGKAAAAYRKALAIEPGLPKVQYSLGMLLAGQSRLEEAAVCFRQAIGIKPDYADAFNSLGMVLARQNMWPEAVTQFSKALALDPDHPKVRGYLEQAKQKVGRSGE